MKNKKPEDFSPGYNHSATLYYCIRFMTLPFFSRISTETTCSGFNSQKVA